MESLTRKRELLKALAVIAWFWFWVSAGFGCTCCFSGFCMRSSARLGVCIGIFLATWGIIWRMVSPCDPFVATAWKPVPLVVPVKLLLVPPSVRRRSSWSFCSLFCCCNS